jgi:hypothetical protein
MSKNNHPSKDKNNSTDPDLTLRRQASKRCFKYLWHQQRDEQDKVAYQRHCAQRLASVYNGNTTQAILFLRAIKANNREPMQPFTIREHFFHLLQIIHIFPNNIEVSPLVSFLIFFFFSSNLISQIINFYLFQHH